MAFRKGDKRLVGGEYHHQDFCHVDACGDV